MPNWKDKFLEKVGSKTVPDLKQETKIKQSEYDLRKGVQDQAQKLRNAKATQDIKKIIRGDH